MTGLEQLLLHLWVCPFSRKGDSSEGHRGVLMLEARMQG